MFLADGALDVVSKARLRRAGMYRPWLRLSGATGGQGDWLNAGDTVTFDVIFDEPVTVDTSGGAPVLSILVGGVQRLATYEATTGSKLVFTYTIAAGDNDASGLSVPADGLQIGGAHIRDAAGNDALTSSPAVPAQSAYKVDTDAPMASSVRIAGMAMPAASVSLAAIT